MVVWCADITTHSIHVLRLVSFFEKNLFTTQLEDKSGSMERTLHELDEVGKMPIIFQKNILGKRGLTDTNTAR